MPNEDINYIKSKSVSQLLSNISSDIEKGDYDNAFGILYPRRGAAECRSRYLGLIDLFRREYCREGENTGGGAVDGTAGDGAGGAPHGAAKRAVIISAPGRTEVCGNHTDHQHGNVLAAAIDLDIICLAVTNEDNTIRIKSAGHQGISVSLNDTSRREDEKGNSTALIRGLTAWFIERGVKLGGFDAYTTNDVLAGSGLSSSAAFEVAAATTMNTLFNGKLTPLDIAIAGQYAENEYFGKPSGLMDQTASSAGGFVQIDFADPHSPLVKPVQCDLSAHGLRLCVVNTKGSHANLIGEYASIPAEMLAVASYYGKQYLRDVDEGEFYSSLAEVREKLRSTGLGKASGDNQPDAANLESAADKPGAVDKPGVANRESVAADRAVLRAMHFFRENKLVPEAAEALHNSDIGHFLGCVTSSGQSSFNNLQNIFSVTQPGEQGLSIALALSESILRGKGGAWRVHGGGFAGTIMSFVPEALHDKYKQTLEKVFGTDSCITLSIRKYGGIEVTKNLR